MDSQRPISVVRDSRTVPLIPAKSGVRRKEQPWRGIVLERHTIGAIEIPEHVHGDFCVHLQVGGHAAMEWWSEGANRVEATGPGSMILLRPGTRDRLRWQEGTERLILSVEPALVRSVVGDSGGVVEVRNQWSLRDGGLEHMLLEMGRQAETGWPLGSLYADLLGVRLASSLVRGYGSVPLKASVSERQWPTGKLRRAMEYMTDNLEVDLRLDAIAKEMDLSAFHFAREFRRSLGQTPYQYLLSQRIEMAKGLLRGGALSVQEVGLRSGFPSDVSFVRAFRQRVGMPPGLWRVVEQA
ncbi:helix-turn-helix domain-containing protein [Granulicella arctica]|uniref:helix-turn-helix domain-containing protein n=1 Tax=Granulicella arctica TaxID=940613 RepID=UPI0021DF49EB|nr:AraC family transcriptional regulator [Granulicella arctica]